MVKIKGKQTSEQDGLVGMAPEGSPFGVPCIPFLLVANPFLQSQVRANASAWYFIVCKALSHSITLYQPLEAHQVLELLQLERRKAWSDLLASPVQSARN